jgi:hypothetical protein
MSDQDHQGLTEAEKNLAASESGKTPFFKVVLTGGNEKGNKNNCVVCVCDG